MEKALRFYKDNAYLNVEECDEDFIIEMTLKDDDQMSAGFLISKDELEEIINELQRLL